MGLEQDAEVAKVALGVGKALVTGGDASEALLSASGVAKALVPSVEDPALLASLRGLGINSLDTAPVGDATHILLSPGVTEDVWSHEIFPIRNNLLSPGVTEDVWSHEIFPHRINHMLLSPGVTEDVSSHEIFPVRNEFLPPAIEDEAKKAGESQLTGPLMAQIENLWPYGSQSVVVGSPLGKAFALDQSRIPIALRIPE